MIAILELNSIPVNRFISKVYRQVAMNLMTHLCFLILMIMISNCISAVETAVTPNVIRIRSLADVQIEQPEETLFLFDLDDTVLDFPYMVGSKGWRRYIDQEAMKIDNSKNWYERIFYFLSQNYPVASVEPTTRSFIANLQKKYVVCGFTARERNYWYDVPETGVDVLTISQLETLGIDFNNHSLEDRYPFFALDSEYFQGTFFCNLEPKGLFLLHLFKDAPKLPSKVVFIDDKLLQVESVANALATLGISHECYYYLATDAKAEAFNPLIANIQLYHFLKSKLILTDEEAASLALTTPNDDDADFYLRAILDMAKDL